MAPNLTMCNIAPNYVSCNSIKLHFTFPRFIITKCPYIRSKFTVTTGHHCMNKFRRNAFLLNMEETLAQQQKTGVRYTKLSLTDLILYCDNYNQFMNSLKCSRRTVAHLIYGLYYSVLNWYFFNILNFALINCHTIIFVTLNVRKMNEKVKNRLCMLY